MTWPGMRYQNFVKNFTHKNFVAKEMGKITFPMFFRYFGTCLFSLNHPNKILLGSIHDAFLAKIHKQIWF